MSSPASSPARADRSALSRSASQRKSYVDLTGMSDDSEGETDEDVHPAQSSSKRKRVASSPASTRTPPSEASESEDAGLNLDEEEYEVEYIVDSRLRNTGAKCNLEYLIHWLNYPKSERSWTLASEFDEDDPPVLAFHTKHPKKPSMSSVRALQRKKSAQSRSDSKMEVESLDEVEKEVKGKTAAAVTKTIETPRSSQKEPVSDKGSQKTTPRILGRSGSLLNWFTGGKEKEESPKITKFFSKEDKGKGKENADPASIAPSDRTKAPTAGTSASPGLKTQRSKDKEVKKRKVVESEDEGSDFVMEVDEAGDDESFKSDAEEAEADVEEGSADFEMVEDDVPVVKSAKTKGGWGHRTAGAPKRKQTALIGFKPPVVPLKIGDVSKQSQSLWADGAPMTEVQLMFSHLVSRVPDIVKVVKRLNGRKLRVATMCSGTESPLLALNMVAKAIKEQHGLTLSFDHVFSCEIEPFKQAYIERNFAPPILFRDVTELGRKKAHTAYGSLVEVPGNVDLLIAGTSCVDYSNLNNQQQDITASGESGRTFRGMLQWVNKHKPAIVILENVCSAPWAKVVDYFNEIDYDATATRLDTKQFYIPHTRTRGYLMATPMGKDQASQKWDATVKELRRPWSSPFEAFLLHTDNPEIHRARMLLASAKELKDGQTRKATDWNRCESRHQRARQEEQLGLLRPLTSWVEAGVCKGLDWTWNDWLLAQTERVVDLLEISTLRMAKDGVDSGFKACIWNVSQNVDRQTGSNKTALAPCLTPNMIPWVTNRGGPVTGREALALQGIPVRDLLLTSENEDQLADLAGNAMTTTVVGATMVAALLVALGRLQEGKDAEADAARIEDEHEQQDKAVNARIIGEDNLQTHELDLAKVVATNLKGMLDLAERSSRHCQCEGQTGTASPIDECTACGYRACQSCGGRPDHVYTACPNIRVEPADFERPFKELLPMRVKIAGLDTASLDAVRARAGSAGKGTVSSKDWSLWSQAVLDGATDAEFHFRYLKRGHTWTAVYEAPSASLDLVLQRRSPEWRLTIHAPVDSPVNSPLRELLLHPVARLRLDTRGQDVLCGPWEVCVPSRQTFAVDIMGRGELVPSWYASLGLGGDHEGTQRWSQLEVIVPREAEKALDRDLSGIYTLLPKCGQAMASLHRKEATAADKDLPQLFFFFDPTREGEAEDDFYVFSASTERLDFGVARATVATLEAKWRETSKAQEKANLNVWGGWVQCEEARLTAVGGKNIAVTENLGDGVHRDTATYSVPSSASTLHFQLDEQACTHATALLSCKVPLDAGHSEAMWSKGQWGEVDLLHEGNATFANLAWITERLPVLDGLSSWNSLTSVDVCDAACERCAPRPPKIHWIRKDGKLNKNGNKTKSVTVAFEDKLEAGRYEYALKHRPAPFVLQLRQDRGIGSFRIGLNIVSLAHRALSRLPISTAKGEIKLSWRLTPGQVAEIPPLPRVFILPSNKKDPQNEQPDGFLLPLRKEQLRSLWWMLEQEKATDKSHTFVEEEISEAALPALGWRAEGKAERPVMVRGGVIADQVGYGKTIISLALVAEARKHNPPEPAPAGLIGLKATLIVVPGHLSRQWPSEIKRFTGSMFNVVIIQNMKDLQNLSILDLRKADIIVMASEVFEADIYWQRMEYLSAQPEDWLKDAQGGRYFNDRLSTAIASLADQVELLKTDGAQAAAEAMQKSQAHAVEEAQSKRDAHKTANFGKRMKGQAYRDRYEEPAKKKAKVGTEGSSKGVWEASDDEEEDEDDEPLPVPTFRSASKGRENLDNADVKKDYKQLKCPLMHMFRFRRVIADEFTYLGGKSLSALLSLSACYKWVLSGTPPVSDFPAIRSIAAFMGIHLGVEDDAEGSAALQKARAKDQTEAERFHAFREVHSVAWHKRRDDLAQGFLNTFVRQNIAEIDDIPTVEHVHHIKLPASEGAVYLELEHHLQALDMQARNERKFKDVTQGDRNARLEEALADSKSAEEALLKRCCHFTLDLTDKKRDAKSAQEACEHIAGARSQQLKGCEEDLYRSINKAVALHLRVKADWKSTDRQFFKEFVDFSLDQSKHQGDAEAAERLINVLRRCGFREGKWPTEVADGSKVKADHGAKADDLKWELREQTHLLRKLSKELVSRVRSLRFFEVVRKLQRNGSEATQILEASECAHRPSTHTTREMMVLSCCGHVACHQCTLVAAESQRCVKGDGCHASVRHTNIVKVKSLGIDGELSSGRYGAKLRRLVDLIHSIPKRERILVFLQWEDLAGKVGEALASGGIPYLTLSGAVKNRANTLDRFQTSDSDDARVLLLKMNDASAAGSNLTTANHAIFLGPLFSPSLLNYRAVETQAIGRVRRYGQEKKVHIHRLLALDTIDMTIYEQRTGELRAKADYVAIPEEKWVGKEGKDKAKPALS